MNNEFNGNNNGIDNGSLDIFNGGVGSTVNNDYVQQDIPTDTYTGGINNNSPELNIFGGVPNQEPVSVVNNDMGVTPVESNEFVQPIQDNINSFDNSEMVQPEVQSVQENMNSFYNNEMVQPEMSFEQPEVQPIQDNVNSSDSNIDYTYNQDINNTYDNSYAQQSDMINTYDNSYAQQSDMMNTYDNSYAQQSDMMNTYDNNYAQQSDVMNTYDNSYAQQSDMVNTYDNSYEQQSDMMNTYDNSYEQQSDMMNTYDNSYAQQSDVMNTYDSGYNQQMDTLNLLDSSYDQQNQSFAPFDSGLSGYITNTEPEPEPNYGPKIVKPELHALNDKPIEEQVEPNQLSGAKAAKGYLLILILVGVLLFFYFTSDSNKKEGPDKKNPTTLYVYSTGTSMTYGNYKITVLNMSDEACLKWKTCNSKLKVELELGEEGKTKNYTVYADGKDKKLDDGKYINIKPQGEKLEVTIYGLKLKAK